MKLAAVGVLVLALAACAPGIPIPMPMPGGPTKATPASSAVESAVTPREGTGAIVVVRDKQLRRSKCTYDIALDGEPVARLRPGEQVALYADPGDRMVGISVGREEGCDTAVAEVPLKVVASATTRIRVRSDARYDLKVEATTY